MSTRVGGMFTWRCRGIGANVEPTVPRLIGDHANRRPTAVLYDEHNGRDRHQQQCHYKAQQAPVNRLASGVDSQAAGTCRMAAVAAACAATVSTPLHGLLTCIVADATPS